VIPVRVEIPGRLVDEFKATAKRVFPNEAAAFLIGDDAGDYVAVDELYIPEDLEHLTSCGTVTLQHHWDMEAREQAQDSGLSIVGTLHSHPYRYGEYIGYLDGAPSEGDHSDLALQKYGIVGICVVAQLKGGALRSSIKFFSPSPPVETKII
jgi:proteasome lid subunit RPN8/RPN11